MHPYIFQILEFLLYCPPSPRYLSMHLPPPTFKFVAPPLGAPRVIFVGIDIKKKLPQVQNIKNILNFSRR